MERVLIAIGGNALYDKGGNNNLHPASVQMICDKIIEVLRMGYLPLITFGNGPQVGNLYDMAETAAKCQGEPVPLDVCVSWTQGEIGYWLSRQLRMTLKANGFNLPVMAVNTTVEVDPQDPAFNRPTKPVGKFISPEEAQRLYAERGWIVGPDSNRGYRRMVPSPRPLHIQEADALNRLLTSDIILLCCGGGGIPVFWDDAKLCGLEAVIDKDFTSCLVAKTLGLENLIICTEVENIYLHFGTPEQTPLRRLSLEDAERYYQEGHFAEGSMGPKVAAMMDYVAHGGKRAFITSLERVTDALAGTAGTEIYHGEASPAARVSA